MKRVALIALPILGLTTPALAADLGPAYEEGAVIERPAPRIIERERIIERRYVAPREEVIVAPRRVYYEPAPYAIVDRPYTYGAYWRRGGHWRGDGWRHAGWRHHGRW